MGKGATAKCPTRRLKMLLTNYQLSFRVHASACNRQRSAAVGQTKVWTLNFLKYLKSSAQLLTSFKPLFCGLLFLLVWAGNSFGQDNVFTQHQIELLPYKILFQKETNKGNIESKREALFQIRNLKSAEASRIAISALQDADEIIRATAAFSVIFLPSDEALQVLLPLLSDKKELVRRETAYALGNVRNPNSVNPLIQILQKDKILEVRNAAIVALGQIGEVSTVAELVKLLQKKPNDKEEFLRRSAARSIGQIAQIIQTDKVKVITPEDFLPEKYQIIEKPKYANLSETFPTFRTANDVLIQTLQNPKETDDVKREAAFALGEIGDVSAIPILQANLNAKDYYLAEISQEALNKIQKKF